MARPLRITDNLVAIFSLMLEAPDRPWYGLELADATEIGSATIYAALTRMERAGLLRARWENHDPAELGRPQRRLYTLTPSGADVGRQALADYKPRVAIKPPQRRLIPGPHPLRDAG